MIDLNKFYDEYRRDSEHLKFRMVRRAETEIYSAIQEGYYKPSDLKDINFNEVCDWCEWPDFHDGGIFEQAIRIAANAVLAILD